MDTVRPTAERPPRPAPRPRRASLVWFAAAALLVYSGVIALTGGVDVVVGGVRVRSRTWQRPALIGLAGLAAVAVADRRRAWAVARDGAAAAGRLLGRTARTVSPASLGVAAAVATLAVGTVFGTGVAGGADSAGYLSQARLLARGRLLDHPRLDPRPPWPDVSYQLTPLGFRPAPDRVRLAPTYPPGYPLLMTPAFLVNERAALLVVPLCGAAAVWLVFALARRFGDPGAGAVAAVLTAASPTFLYQLVQPMSDVPVTAAWLLALFLAATGRLPAAAGAGMAAAVAILIRPNLAPLAVVVWAACAAAASRRRWPAALAAVAGTIPGPVVLGVIQQARYGSPLASGYAPLGDLFALANVLPNLERYPRWMLETHTPLIAAFLLAPLWIARRAAGARALYLLLWLFAMAVVLAYLPYVYFQTFEWTYTRFLLPAIPLMWLLTAVPAVRAARGRAGAAALLALIVAALAAFSLSVARSRYVFELREGERKYVLAAGYLRRALPPNSAAISMQHSGSLWFYTGLPVVRWDHVPPARLDESLAWLSANGYAPVMVVDADELERMRERFGPAGQRALGRARVVAVFGPARILTVD